MAGLLITDTSVEDVRPTDDVDVVVAMSSYANYARLQEELRQRNFLQVERGPTCRHRWNGIFHLVVFRVANQHLTLE